ncbi:MAG: glycosyltransferase family 2 protein [Chitinophagaceae bacterium]|nr:glycosyltransferase family 2 protein [Chitinophagaceae bacterium]
MKISGFTFVRNAVKFDYPVIESINSILPIVDEFIVSVGNCDDGTLELIQSINSPKIKIVHSVWDDSLKEGGKVLAVETDKVFAQISPDADWAFYLQADEVVHEKDLPKIVKAAQQHLHHKKVEGLIFEYKHFYGTYDYIGDSRRWYAYEIRMIKNNKEFYSYRDGQGFRTGKDRKLFVKHAHASIYHYGWVRHPHKQLEKLSNFYGLWNGEGYNAPALSEKDQFDFFKNVDSVSLFKGQHPAVMQKRIVEKNWHLDLDVSKKKFSLKDKILYRLERLTGKRLFRFRNYTKV